jgi:uncharacterized protein
MILQPTLTQHQRILVSACYIGILIAIYKLIGGIFGNLVWDQSIDSSIWFYSGAFMIILGAYIIEPFFTKPSDAIANATAVIIALLGLSNKNKLFGYTYIFYFTITILVLSLVTILLKDTKNEIGRKAGRIFYWIAENGGSSKFIFSLVYLSAAYSYFGTPEKLIAFIGIIAFWICLTFFDVIGMIVERISKLIGYISDSSRQELGQAIGCENPLLYKIEIDYKIRKYSPIAYGDLVIIETSINIGSIGMVIDTKHLLNKRWLSIYLLQSNNGDVLKINIREMKSVSEPKSIYVKENLAYLLDASKILDLNLRKEIDDNLLYRKREQFIGYVTKGSNINIVNFAIVREADKLKHKISEGTVLNTLIYGKETLYQVINGNAEEEHLEKFDRHGFIVGIARKLGKYDVTKNELNISKWMPSTYTPVYLAFSGDIDDSNIKDIATTAIGRLPETNLKIPIKDIDAIVTHNTAILGILGIGKSCLAYELIKKLTTEGVKIICIDITNEYKKELPNYIPEENAIITDNENSFNTINNKYDYIQVENGNKQNPEKSGNIHEYKSAINTDLCNFLFSNDTVPDNKIFEVSKKVRIYNLDYHKASRGEKIGFNVITTDLTQAEKTRILAEEIFRILMKIPLADEKKAKVLVVFEEAHSLIPEWNSVANEGDKNATNGTAKVIYRVGNTDWAAWLLLSEQQM